MSDFWSKYNETMENVRKEESAGGGIICEAEVSLGYKVFAKAMSQEDTFFASPGDESGRQAAKSAARNLAQPYSLRPQWGVMIRAYRANAFTRGEPVTWQGDRFLFTPLWWEESYESVMSSLQENGINEIPGKYWLRVGFMPSPFHTKAGDEGKVDTDQNGNKRFPQVAYAVEKFDNVEAADTAVRKAQGVVPAETEAKAVDASGKPPVPAAWVKWPDSWEGEVKEALEAFGNSPRPMWEKGINDFLGKKGQGYGATPAELEAWVEYLS